MPLFDFRCTECGGATERLVSIAERDSGQLRCERQVWPDLDTGPDTGLDDDDDDDDGVPCQGVLQYAGLSAPTIGRVHVFGVIMNDGRKVAGHINKDAPMRRRPRPV